MGQAVLATVTHEPVTGGPVTLRPLSSYEPSAGAQAQWSGPGRPRLRAVPELIVDVRDDIVLPAVRGIIRRLLAVMVEAMDGRRPVHQLRGQLDLVVYSAIQTRARTLSRPLVSRLRSIHLSQPLATAVEACAVVEAERQVRALAARFELAGKSVRCSALRLI